jgi:hypothetical protein
LERWVLNLANRLPQDFLSGWGVDIQPCHSIRLLAKERGIAASWGMG